MKKRFFLFILPAFLAIVVPAQEKLYKGTFTVGENLSANTFVIKVRDNSFTATYHMRIGEAFQVLKDKKDHSNDYTDISGSCTGAITGHALTGSGKVAVEENDAGVFTKNYPPASLQADITEKEIRGQLLVGEEEPTPLSFVLVPAGDEKPELTFPAGKSPKVFDKGWVFGASFNLLTENGELVDLSDQVEWSGTASFNPAKGKKSHPVFKTIGPNKIILTATYQGKTYKNEFGVETVSDLLYGHTGSISMCEADAHGCLACPHPSYGPLLSGSTLILANGYPAASVGDRGIPAGCCGQHYFTITSGDNQVLIEGKPAARIGLSATAHCGGNGKLIGGFYDVSIIINAGGEITHQDIEPGNTNGIRTGDVLKTNDKGIIVFPGNYLTPVTLFPNSILKILEQTKEQIKLFLEKGSMLVEGKTDADKKINIQSKDFAIKPNGTKFLLTTDNTGNTSIICYEGELLITKLATGSVTKLDSGYSFQYGENKSVVVPLPGNEYLQTMKNLMGTVDSKSVKEIIQGDDQAGRAPGAGNKNESFLSRYKFYLAGGALLLLAVLVMIFRKRRK